MISTHKWWQLLNNVFWGACLFVCLFVYCCFFFGGGLLLLPCIWKHFNAWYENEYIALVYIDNSFFSDWFLFSIQMDRCKKRTQVHIPSYLIVNRDSHKCRCNFLLCVHLYITSRHNLHSSTYTQLLAHVLTHDH